MARGFRVWDKQTKSYERDREFVLGLSGELMELYSNHNGTWEYHFADTNRFIVEFETGLTDKNANMICEGDIVEGDMGIFEVKWYDLVAQFMFAPNIDMKWHPPFVYDQVNEMEVIGNIHENPELPDDSLHDPYGPIGEENIGGESRRMQK